MTLLITNSCTKDDLINDFPSAINFGISGHLLEGKKISSIDTDDDGNIWIASDKELYYSNSSYNKSYSLDYPILDIAVAPDNTVWIGTNGGGLAHFTGKAFTWYTKANSGFPRDYVRHVEAGPDGKIWFSSCAFKLGGLGMYDGNKFEFFTPENSPLNQNVIEDIEIGDNGNIFIATSGTVGKTNIYHISEKSWDCLGDEKGTFYWIFSFTVGLKDNIFLVEDFSLSSSSYNSNKFFEYKDKTWNNVETGFMSGISPFTSIRADKRNYCWLAGIGDNSAVLHVYDGNSWVSSPEGTFPEDFITTIEVDKNNNILVGTYENGVFILNQSN